MSKVTYLWLRPGMDNRISAHVQAWEKAKGPAKHLRGKLPFVTISRQFGCEAVPLSFKLAEILNERCRPSFPWVAYDQELLDTVAKELHLRREIVESLDERRRDAMTEFFDAVLNRRMDDALVFRKMAEVIRTIAMHGHSVLVGRGAYLLTQDLKMGLHVRLEAPISWRIQRVAEDRHISIAEAEKLVKQYAHQREQFLKTFFVHNPEHPFHHDLIIETSRFNLDQMVEIVFAALSVKFGDNLVGN